MNHYVLIVETGPKKIVRVMGPMSEHKAERVERGASINLNHESYHTAVVESDETPEVGEVTDE